MQKRLNQTEARKYCHPKMSRYTFMKYVDPYIPSFELGNAIYYEAAEIDKFLELKAKKNKLSLNVLRR